MNIGQAAKQSGVSAKMIRHYESIGLIPRVPRGPSGYRRYEGADVMRLAFVRNARDAGLGMADIKRLLGLWQDQKRSSRDVRALVAKHLHEIEARIAGLRSVQEALTHLMAHCRGDDRPECPVLDAFEAKAGAGSRDAKIRLSRAGLR